MINKVTSVSRAGGKCPKTKTPKPVIWHVWAFSLNSSQANTCHTCLLLPVNFSYFSHFFLVMNDHFRRQIQHYLAFSPEAFQVWTTLMGNCGNHAPNCTSWREGLFHSTVRAEPDIAGLGVSFLLNCPSWLFIVPSFFLTDARQQYVEDWLWF